MAKKISTCCFLLFLTFGLFAQQKSNVITRDTVNLIGYVYDFDGTPKADVIVQSRQMDADYNSYPLNASTDKNGFFKINGAKFNDTLLCEGARIFNNGSRYISIYLPVPTNRALHIEITARRTHKKSLINLNIKDRPSGEISGFETQPTYPGGMDEYKTDILKKCIYPPKAIKNNIEGTVEIAFTVFKDGTTGNFKLIKGIGYGCDDELIKAIKNMRKWNPGAMFGHRIDYGYVINMEFKLTDK